MSEKSMLTTRDVNFMLCGGDPNEEGIGNKEKARRLRKLADLKDVEAEMLRKKADEVERGFDSETHERLHRAVEAYKEQQG